MATEIIRPNTTYGTGSFPVSFYTPYVPTGDTTTWECVDESVSDSDSTYMAKNVGGDQQAVEIFGYEANSLGVSDIINSLIIYAISKNNGGKGGDAIRFIYDGSARYVSSPTSTTTAYSTYRQVYSTNPETGVTWTKSEIDSLKMGVNNFGTLTSRVTQVYIEIDYTPGSTPITIKPILMFLESDD